MEYVYGPIPSRRLGRVRDSSITIEQQQIYEIIKTTYR
jgi:hypothetical protein